ncbi:hypothetical protein BLNAU_7225 [Blattamonas nauphoetae]|uniref:Uncharacterized protein n=1 Tax=Blattamonas nauphoetae TaxID=2049346 RepID=A0ABQ9Y229_9EUKA|nr:hypothetical protein BLNAU_7225 [Blattamonas nauphoetae]
MKFDPRYSRLSYDEQLRVYCSLVALVKAEYPFDEELQDNAAHFLKRLHPKCRDEPRDVAELVTDLVPSSVGSTSGFVESILTLLSSPHLKVYKAALSFLAASMNDSPQEILCLHLESDLITKVLATVQPHTLPISGNERMFTNLTRIIVHFVNLETASNLETRYLNKLGLATAAVDTINLREMIFQKVVLPSS